MQKHRLLKQGYRAVVGGNPKAALECAEKVLSRQPNCRRACCLKALALHELDRSEEALEVLKPFVENASDSGHLPYFLKAVIELDRGRLQQAADSAGAARLLTHPDNPASAGLVRLTAALQGKDLGLLSEFADSPALYNEFVAPRLLLVLEEQIAARFEPEELKNTYWARYGEDASRTDSAGIGDTLGFWIFRFPVLLLCRILGKPTMPLSAEAAYMRGDVQTALQIVSRLPATGRTAERRSHYVALLSFESDQWQECLSALSPEAEKQDPFFRFMRGYCYLRLGKWQKARSVLEELKDLEPAVWYFLGLALLRLGEKNAARRAFTRCFYADDLEAAGRIIIAGRILKIFPGDPNKPPFE